jgi:predicted DCC family thiol-disulfide oxidoreductase YuxK
VSPPAPGREVLLVDGDCRVCRSAAAVLAPGLPATCEIRSFRSPGALQGLPVDAQRCERAIQLVEADGRVSEGLEAISRALRGRWYGPLLRLYYLPGLRQLLDAGYGWVARRRRGWGG